MKRILIIDESELFRDYLKRKLSESGDVEITAAVNGLDGLSKMRTSLPDLIILDYHMTRKTCREVLEEKKRNPNTANVPVIVTAAKIDKNRILELVPYDVRKVFSKPVRIDTLLKTVESLIGIKFTLDDTPCMIDAHVNDNILFIEVAQGLNREKIDILSFRIEELLSLYDIEDSRILLMLSDLDLSFADAANLELLLSNVIKHSRAKNRHIRILTASSFVRDFIAGHEEFRGIEVCSSLDAAVSGLLVETRPPESGDEAPSLAERLIATPSPSYQAENFQLRFQDEAAKAFAVERGEDAGKGLSFAVVDDDIVIQELVRTVFSSMNAQVMAFDDGSEFLEAVKAGKNFDLVFLDLVMQNIGGFAVLSALQGQDVDIPVIVLSAVSQREAIVKAFHAGVKSYLIKPLKPSQIVKKAAEILRANF